MPTITNHPPAPLRWLLALAVRLLRAPAVRRRLLPLLFPGQHTDRHGRVLRDRWEVGPPALGNCCVPGCDDPEVDWDGLHYCRVRVGRVGLPEMYRWAGEVHGLGVEVTQTQGEPRNVWLVPLKRNGADHGDTILLTPGARCGRRSRSATGGV